MERTFTKTSVRLFLSYIFITCIYVIALRVSLIPISFSYILYTISIFLFFFELSKKGFNIYNLGIDVRFCLSFIFFYFISSIIYISVSASTNISWIFKDWLFSLMPMLFYVLFRVTKVDLDKSFFLQITLYTIFIFDIINLILFLFPSSSLSVLFKEDMIYGLAIEYALSGVLGVIFVGFTNVIGLAICLFSPIPKNRIIRWIFSVFFILCVFLSGQRTPVGGVILLLFFKLYRDKTKGFVSIALILLLFIMFVDNISLETTNYSVFESLTERYLGRFEHIALGTTGRESQYYISEKNFLTFLLGDGAGKYSPENPDAIISLQDAMLYRIYNEMGVIGLSIFILFFLVNIRRAWRTKNIFILAILIYIFIANSFNRVLFIAPLSIIPYMIIALYNWRDD